MKLLDKEIEAVSQLDPYERYKYFIKRVADSELLYTLIDKENTFALADVEAATVFSVWSAPEFASACAIGEWSSFAVKKITLEEFEEEVIEQIAKNGWLLNVFSVKGKSGFVVDIIEFAKDLSEEMKRYQ